MTVEIGTAALVPVAADPSVIEIADWFRGPPGPPSTVNHIPHDHEGNIQTRYVLSQAAYDLIADPDPRVDYIIIP